MNPIIACVLYVYLFCIFSSSMAQNKIESNLLFDDDILITEVNPLHPFGIFTLETPFYTGAYVGRGEKFSIGYSFGNIWHPKSTIFYPQNLNIEQQETVNNLLPTERPSYFSSSGIETTKKSISTDGILQNLSFTWLKQFGKSGSFIAKLNTHMLSDGKFFLHYPAKDGVIESIHDKVGKYDNFGRRQYIFDQAHINYTDENNRTISINNGDFFLGTLTLNYYRPLWKKLNPSSYYLLQFGLHTAIPLNQYYQKVSAGVSGCMLYRKKITHRFGIDLAGDISLSKYNLIDMGRSINMIDREVRLSAKMYIGFNIISRHGNAYSVGLINNYQEAFLKGNIFSSEQDLYRNLGIQYLRPGEIWEGFEVKNEFKLAKLTAASMYFFSIKSYLFFAIKRNKTEFLFSIGEDYLSVNNAPDIQFGFQMTRNISR